MSIFRKYGWGSVSQRIVYSTGTTFIYNEGVAITLLAGSRGITLRHLHIDPVLIINLDCTWGAYVFKGDLPGDVRIFQASNVNIGYPKPAPSTLGVELLNFCTLKPTRPAFGGDQLFPVIRDWTDGSGPSVEAGQMMTVLIVPMINASPVGLNSEALITVTALGGEDIGNSAVKGAGSDQALRSMPRGSF